MDQILDGRNYFRRTAVRAKTLRRGDVLSQSGLIVLNVCTKDSPNIAQVIGNNLATYHVNWTNESGLPKVARASEVPAALEKGYVLVKAAYTGIDDEDEKNVHYLLLAGLAVLEIWEFSENS